LLQEEIFPIEQASKANPGSRVGEFEKHTKGFGSRYMSKFGFEKGKGLEKMSKAFHNPSHTSRTTRPPHWEPMEVL